MQENSDQKASSQDEAGDLRTSPGEVVRRVDLDRAAGTPSRFVCDDPSVAGYEGAELAKAALAGDQAALSNERMSVATSALASIANVIGVEDCPTPWIENTRDAILTEIRRRTAEAEKLDLQEGDVVTLTVGGNQMTVTKVHGEGQHFGQIEVAWFGGTTLHRDTFEKTALVRV